MQNVQQPINKKEFTISVRTLHTNSFSFTYFVWIKNAWNKLLKVVSFSFLFLNFLKKKWISKNIKLCDTTAIRNWNCRPWYCVWCMTITISTYFFLCVSFSFNFIHFVMFCSLNHINKLCINLCIWNCYYFIKTHNLYTERISY